MLPLLGETNTKPAFVSQNWLFAVTRRQCWRWSRRAASRRNFLMVGQAARAPKKLSHTVQSSISVKAEMSAFRKQALQLPKVPI